MEDIGINEAINYCYDDIFRIEELESRRLYINGVIDSSVIDSIVYHILRYNRIDRDLATANREPIIIYLNSDGGDYSAGFGVIDAILASKTPVYTVNLANCYSMGFLIFLAGEKRYAMPNSTFCHHNGSTSVSGNLGEVKDRMQFELGEMEYRNRDYVVSRTKITAEKYAKNYRKEWYFYPEEAKELGVATNIVGIDCEIDDVL